MDLRLELEAGALLIGIVMKLRALPFCAMLTLGLAVAVIPTYGLGRGSDTNQQNNQLPYPGKVVEQIVARVDDQVIDTSDYKRGEKQLEQRAQHDHWSQARLAKGKKNLLRNMIDKQLLLAKGKQLSITGEDELIHRLDEIRKQNQLKSMQALRQAVESQGLSWQDFKQQIRQNIIESRVIQQKVMPNVRISPQEVRAYYERHKSDFKHPEQVRLSEILIPTPKPDDAAQVAKAQAKAEAIEKQLKAGADFAKLAKKDSGGPNASQGGDLGVFKKGQLAPVLENDTFPLKAGQFTKPIQTRQGWIILKVTKHQAAGVTPLNQVRSQIMNEIGYKKMQPALRKYLSKLRRQAYIDIRPGYTDTGATANEVKPVYTAYLPPQEHKKKKPHFRRKRYESARRRKERREEKRGTEKLGKKEKIRYGQAPREALPPALNQTDQNNSSGQVAANNNATEASQAQQNQETKPRKVRYSSLALKRRHRRHEKKLKQEKEAKKKKNSHYPAPVVGKLAKATQQVQEQSLGLGGVTKTTKKHPMRHGPKRRYSKVQRKKEQEKKQKQEDKKSASTSSSSGSTSSGSAGSGSQQ